jgi:hypothetical protein
MTLTKKIFGLAMLILLFGLTGCYTVIMVPKSLEPADSRSADAWTNDGEYADTTAVVRENGSVVNNFYIYDDWPGHWYFDPFWDSPYHWRYSSWWGGGYNDPWWDPWPYYGYGWGPSRYWGNAYWNYPGFNDPYWVYMDGTDSYQPNKKRPFEQRDGLHTRGDLNDPGFASRYVSGTSGLGKESGPNILSGTGEKRNSRPSSGLSRQKDGGMPSVYRKGSSAETEHSRGNSASTPNRSSSPSSRSSGSKQPEKKSTPTTSSGSGNSSQDTGYSGHSSSGSGSGSSSSGGSHSRSSGGSSGSSSSSSHKRK